MSSEPNLRVLKRSRTKPAAGDIFVMRLPDKSYLFGRVILADLPADEAPMPTSNLVYIYDVQSPAKAIPLESLTPDRLLLAPQYINGLPWSKGYFETIGHQHLHESDLLPQHCFRDSVRQVYRDVTGEIIDGPVEPCGEWGLGSYGTIDDLISDVLGIPRAPE